MSKLYNNIKQYGVLALGAVTLAACNDYLDEPPTKSDGTTIETVEQLSALMNTYHFEKVIEYNMAAVLASDAYAVNTEYYDKGLSAISTSSEPYQYACWQMQHTSNVNEKVSLWNQDYERIYTANLVLESVGAVEGTAPEKEMAAQRAHLIRAYNYLDLVQYYCMPYGESTKAEPGLPLKQTTHYDEGIGRATLQATYDFIERDILEAVKLKEPLMKGDVRQDWAETGALANAVAARFYLLTGQYAKAQQYAETALAFGDDLMDFNEGKELTMTVKQSIDWTTFEITEERTSSFLSASTANDNIAKLDRAYYLRKNYYVGDVYYWGVPSQTLLNAYDKKYDQRYLHFIEPKGQAKYYFGMYSTKFSVDVPGYFTFDSQYSNAPNVAEMHLIRAEAQARQGKVQEAMATLNAFRAKRISHEAPANVVNLEASSEQAAVKHVLDERLREFPFSLRWYDIRRVNFNTDPSDDITVTREFYDMNEYSVLKEKKTYTLAPGALGYAVAIPNAEVSAGKGAIVQNKY